MLEAKDRIVKTTEENCHNTLEERLVEQDRISFPAGEKQGIEKGRREVAEWIDQNIAQVHFFTDRGHDWLLTGEDWQAFKKEKGIE